MFVSSNKFTIKIDRFNDLSNVIILIILYHKYLIFLYIIYSKLNTFDLLVSENDS